MKKDYSSVKFDAVESLGEWMNCLYLKFKNSDPCDFDYDFIHHRECDGMGAITKILTNESHKVNAQPSFDNVPHFNAFQKLSLLRKFVKETSAIKTLWLKKRVDTTGIPQSFHYLLLDTEQSNQLKDLARKQKVSLNSWLLHNLDRAALNKLISQDSQRKWICPINMRGPKQAPVYNGNFSASIVVNLNEQDKEAKRIHQKIKSYLQDSIHWGSYVYSNMARFIGLRGTRYIAKKIKDVGTGVFSNLGDWPNEKIDINESAQSYTHRIVIVPTTQVLPIAAASWCWQDKIALSIQLHPSLGVDDQCAKEVLSSWLSLSLNQNIELKSQHHLYWSSFKECPQTLIKPINSNS